MPACQGSQDCCSQFPWPHSRPLLTHTSARDSWTLRQVWLSLLWGYCSIPLVLVPQGSVCALQESVSPVLCEFWQLCGGVNGDLLQEGLCHTQVCSTQSPCFWGRPWLTHAFAVHTQTQFWLSYVESLGTGAHKACLSPLSVSGG